MVELAAAWLIAAYQIGYGLAAFGGGALQQAVSLPTLYRLTAILAVLMGLLSLPITGTLRRPAAVRRIETITETG
jgi:MFS transporter, FHS family, glucose/mannose:H+ symporter